MPTTDALDSKSYTAHPRYDEYEESGGDWLGEIPAHWKTGPLKYFVSIDPQSLSEDTDDGFQLRYVDIGSVSSTGEIEEPEEYRFEDAPSRARKIVEHGDTIISTVRTYLKAIAYIEDPPENLVVSTGFAVLRPGEDVDERFLGYLIRSKQFLDSAVSHSEGIGYPSISTKKLGRLPVWLPSLPEQKTIAAYLDRETERIDALIEKKEKLIDLLEEKRKSLISRVVTKGLDDNVEMQDSGVEWVGDIPGHWKATKLMHVTPSDRKIMYGIILPGPHYEGGIPIIKGGDVKPGQLKPENLSRTDPEIDAENAKSRVQAGDIVYAIRGSIGEAEQVPDELEGANLTQDVARISPKNDINGRWLLYVVRSAPFFAQLEAGALGATVKGINIRDLKRGVVPMPPPDEQNRIADHLDRATERINTLVEKIEDGIERLKEYRTALISAAVTGQVDVRGTTSQTVGHQNS